MKRSYLIAIVISVSAFVWILSGVFGGNGTAAEDQPAPQAAEIRPMVRVMTLRAEPYQEVIGITGMTEAHRNVTLRAEVESTVARIVLPQGTPVAADDPVILLTENDLPQRVERARTLLKQREIEFKAARALETRGFNSEVRLAEARALRAAARADLKAAERDLANTKITAPFDGQFDQKYVEVGDFVSKGNALARMVDLSPLKVIGYASERVIGKIAPDGAATVNFPDGGSVTGTVSFVSVAAQPETRTFRVEITVPNEDETLRDGVTADLRIPTPSVQAMRIPLSAISLGDDGTIGVKIVDAADTIRFRPVTILADTNDGLWITGLPDTSRLVTVGHEFVADGQPVIADEGGQAPADS